MPTLPVLTKPAIGSILNLIDHPGCTVRVLTARKAPRCRWFNVRVEVVTPPRQPNEWLMQGQRFTTLSTCCE